MGLDADLLHSLAGLESVEARRVAVGPRFFGIGAAESGRNDLAAAGFAFLTQHQRPEPAAVATATARAHGQRLARVAGWIQEEALVYRTLGAAAVNALLAEQLRREHTSLGDENGLDVLAREGAGKRLAVVGRFPYLEEIRAKAVQSWILELEPEEGEEPANRARDVLPQADVVGITGSTFANGTLEGLLALCRPDAFVVLIGPTTPLSPVLFDYGVDVLCGVLAEEPVAALDAIQQEGSTRRIPGTHAVSLRRR